MVKWFRLAFGLKSSWLKNPWLKSLELKCSGISTLPAYPVPSNITAKQSKTTAITELQPINEIPVKAIAGAMNPIVVIIFLVFPLDNVPDRINQSANHDIINE